MSKIPLRRRLPPPNALVVFEAAARSLNFTVAAGELGVTQAAVSRQIQNLEAFLGVALFERAPRRIGLTRAGSELQETVALGLEHIAKGVDLIRSRRKSSEVVLASTVAVSSLWLRPRVAAYMNANPGADVRLLAVDDELPSTWRDAGLGIRFGTGHWPGFETAHLFAEEVFPVCSPEYLEGRSLRGPRDLARCTLLNFDRKSLDGVDWQRWLGSFGYQLSPEGKELRFNNYPIVVQAAVEGQGIALGWNRLVSDLVDQGRLVRPIGDVVRTRNAYWLSWRSDRGLSDEARAIRDYLLGA